jgi:hypothetical protein
MAWEDVLRIVNALSRSAPPDPRRPRSAPLDPKPPAARPERLCPRRILPQTVPGRAAPLNWIDKAKCVSCLVHCHGRHRALTAVCLSSVWMPYPGKHAHKSRPCGNSDKKGRPTAKIREDAAGAWAPARRAKPPTTARGDWARGDWAESLVESRIIRRESHLQQGLPFRERQRQTGAVPVFEPMLSSFGGRIRKRSA